MLIGETFIGVQPDTLQMTNDGKTLDRRACARSRRLALMDTETLVSRFVTFPGFGISGHEWLSANGKYTFVALENTSRRSTRERSPSSTTTSGQILDNWTYPGGPWPHGVFYEPQVLR